MNDKMKAKLETLQFLFNQEIIDLNNGKVIGNGDVRIYCQKNGTIRKVYKTKTGWKFGFIGVGHGGGGCPYDRIKFPGSQERITVHVVMAYAFGLFTGIKDLKKYIVNHKNFNKKDNSLDNLEVILIQANADHARIRDILVGMGVFVEGSSFEAAWATHLLAIFKGMYHIIVTAYRTDILKLQLVTIQSI